MNYKYGMMKYYITLTQEKCSLKTVLQDICDTKKLLFFSYLFLVVSYHKVKRHHILTKSYGFIVGYEGYEGYIYYVYCAIFSESYSLDSYLGSLNISFVSYLTYS